VNSLNDAISVVHDPDSCSVIDAISEAGSTARTGPMIRSRYCSAAEAGSISRASRPGTPATAVTRFPIG